MRIALFPLMVLGLITGCSSIRTTSVDRTEHDQYIENCEEPLKGMPVMLRVPTHLEVSILETRYWQIDEEADLQPLESKRAVLDIKHDLKYTEKMFVVDPLRPLSGDQEYGFSFTGGTDGNAAEAGKGYLSGLSYKATDTSIVDSAALIGAALKRFGTTQANDGEGAAPSNVVETQRVIAFRRFDVNSPTFENDVYAFLECYLNNRACDQKCQVTPSK